jgi:hypothetical protein
MRFSTLLIVTTAFVETGHGLKLVPLTRSVDVSDTVVGSPVKLSETTGPIDRYISNTTHNTDIGPTFHIAAIVFDPKNGANDAMWAKYISKGEHNICLMKATDAGAGFLESDPRNPPSSASKWTGDLRGTHIYLAPDFLANRHEQTPAASGSGTRTQSRTTNVTLSARD